MSEHRDGVKSAVPALLIALVVSCYTVTYLMRHRTTTFVSATNIGFATMWEDVCFAPAKFIHSQVAANHFSAPAEEANPADAIGTMSARHKVPINLKALINDEEDGEQP